MPKKINAQLCARCVRLVREHLQEYPTLTAAATTVARQKGISKESMGWWLTQGETGESNTTPVVLMFDEPEAWLHPRAQLKLGEAFSKIGE